MGQSHSHDDGAHGHSHSHGGHGHSHSHSHSHGAADLRAKMLPATAGTTTALLTAHLSRADGNELDIFIEDAKRSPLALPIPCFTATVDVPSTGEKRSVDFVPAEADERPEGSNPDRCSHFVAKTPWLVASSTIAAVVTLPLPDADPLEFRWDSFVPKTYAHHDEDD